MSFWQSHSTKLALMLFWIAKEHMRCIHSRTNSGVFGVALSAPNIIVNRPLSMITCWKPASISASLGTLMSESLERPLMNG